MTLSNMREQALESSSYRDSVRPRAASMFMLGITVLTAALVAGWFISEGNIESIFSQFQRLQDNPPLWLQVPMIARRYLFVPTISLGFLVWSVTRFISPQPRTWSRFLVIGLLLLLTGWYFLWRSLSTLNLSTPLNTFFSVSLLLLELLTITSSTIQLFLMLIVKDRHREADHCSIAVIEGQFKPSVDILIPTYNEPSFILKRTVIGCQALEYSNKKIYLLDDTQREELRQLAADLGCEYITRTTNDHAKAGNLNNALKQTQGEFVVVFDADFIPTKNFLTRTLGFFQDPQVALVQTPQTFYNADPIARNLGLENVLTSEEEVFYRQVQQIRDGAGSVICSGTSFVVRRSALQETGGTEGAGGFVTDSLSEDYFTGVQLSAQGYKLIYLNEKLSAGLAAENIAAHALQRLRWARGTLQAFFISSNPLTIKGLTPIQRLAHSEGLLHWFTSISTVGFLLMPLAYSFLGVIPIRATPEEIVYFFLPYYVVQLTVFSWLNYRSRSALLSNIYSLTLAFPLAITVVQVLFRPFAKGFKVTPKGTLTNRYSFNWRLAAPLVVLFLLTAISLWRNLGLWMVKSWWQTTVAPEVAEQIKGLGMGWFWSAYNLVMIWIALLILLDVPKPDIYDWFDLRRTVRLSIAGKTVWGITTMISEGGVEVELTQKLPDVDLSAPLSLEVLEHQLTLQGSIVACDTPFKANSDKFPTLRIQFEELTLAQSRCLVEILFCRPGQWKSKRSPGELQSLALLLRLLLKPRVIFDRKIDISPVNVAKV
jgi:cellulose synthase (UDP-forming)